VSTRTPGIFRALPSSRVLFRAARSSLAKDGMGGEFEEAPTGLEPVCRVLQTRASTPRPRRPDDGVELGADEGIRTLDLLHGKQTL
jgi:hypothetical protein